MKKKYWVLALGSVVVVALIICISTFTRPDTTKAWEIYSPDSSILMQIKLTEKGEIFYNVKKNNYTVLSDSKLGLKTELTDFNQGMDFESENTFSENTTYTMPHGKKKEYTNQYNGYELTFNKDGKKIKITAKTYNDGVAFLYSLDGEGETVIEKEYSEFNFPTGTKGWGHKWRDEYEGDFKKNCSIALNFKKFSMPFLASIKADTYWALISEANIINADGSYCQSIIKGSPGEKFRIAFAPSQTEPIKTKYPFSTPQRFIIITDNLNDLVNSNLQYNLNPPSKIDDTSWIKPGRAVWSWWSGYERQNVNSDIELQKEYVDFASEMGFEYITVDCGWADWKNGTVKELCSYAKQKNVDVFLWSISGFNGGSDDDILANPYYAGNFTDKKTGEYIENIKKWAEWGVKGIKVDFFMDDSQNKMAEYQRITELCAENKLMVNFHGSTKPGGESRTWPNIISCEAVRGSEHYLDWFPKPKVTNSCILPFTRNVIGSMDYTPCTISLKNIDTSHAFQLALPIIYESGVQHYADSKDIYKAWKGTELIKEIPANWDETKLIDGYPGKYVVMARRNNDNWFIGGITKNKRNQTINLDFLNDGTYKAYIYKDGNDKSFINKEILDVTKESVIEIPMLKKGGFAIMISKTDAPTPLADNNTIFFEAEAPQNKIAGKAKTILCENCSGGKKVSNLNKDKGELIFNGINVSENESGKYQCMIYFLSEETPELEYSINGNSAQKLLFCGPSGNNNNVRVLETVIELEAGENSIRFFSHGTAPEIDKIGLRFINS